MTAPVLVLVVVVVAALGSTVAMVRRVPAGHVGVRLRLGEYDETLAPGLHFKLPGDRLVTVPLVEQEMRVRRQPVPAGDGREVMIEATVRYRVVDAFRLVREGVEVDRAIESALTTMLRLHLAEWTAAGAAADPDAVIGELPDGLGGPLSALGVEVGAYDVRLDLPG